MTLLYRLAALNFFHFSPSSLYRTRQTNQPRLAWSSDWHWAESSATSPAICTTVVTSNGFAPATTTTTVIPNAKFTKTPLNIIVTKALKQPPRATAKGVVQDNIFALHKAWVLAPKTPQAASPAPGPTSVLRTFAAVNVISALLGFILGRRSVVRRLSFGILGWQRTLPQPTFCL